MRGPFSTPIHTGVASFLLEQGPGAEIAQLFETHGYGASRMRLTFHRAGLDRILTLVRAECGAVLMLEGASDTRCDGVVHREVHDDGVPLRVEFKACWSATNKNPSLKIFLDILRERHPDYR